jgi:CubicO group peptidase (beta-lactamase class C family)
MDRRSFLLTAAAGTLATLPKGAAQIAAAQQQPVAQPDPQAAPPAPWFDGSYDNLPTLEQQVEGLSSIAIDAQMKPRTLKGLPITGLPLEPSTFDEQIVDLLKSSRMVGVGYAVGVKKELKVARGIGYLSSHERIPATPTTPGLLCSNTKPLCAMTGLTLVRDGKVKLDDRVLDVLPLTPLLKRGEKRQPEIDRVTFRMVLSHMSGLFNAVESLFDRDLYKKWAAEGRFQLIHGDISQYDLVRRGMSVPFLSQPGKEFHYSGQGLQVVGRINEYLTGKRLDKAMSARMLLPLGVKHHAQFCYLAPQTFAHIAAGRASQLPVFMPSPFDDAKKTCISSADYQQWGQADSCGASMLSAVNHLRFVTFCFDLLGKDLMTEVLTPPKTPPYSNGLGWGVGMTNGHYQYGHSGANAGMRTMCESLANGVQYSILVAGDRDDDYNKIIEVVKALGNSLHKKADIGGWEAYGFKEISPQS